MKPKYARHCSDYRSPSTRPHCRLERALLAAAVLVFLASSWGCTGFVGAQSSQPSPAPQAYTLSGTISPTTGGGGATVALTGAASATVTADSSGNFTFTGLANGTYTVTPSRAGYAFSPSRLTVTISGASVTSGVTFTASALTYSISGTISPTAGGSGATVALSGAATATVTTDASGNYTFSGLSNGSYALTPSHTGYTFNPTSQNATINTASVTGINFTATPQVGTFTISGTITPTAGGSGATVTLSGPAAANTTTDTSGSYTFSGLANGTYTVTPSNTGYAFTPVSQSVTINGTNQVGVNFLAAVQTGHSVTLTWIASTTSTVTGYNVYRSTTNGTGYAKINSTPVLAPTVTYTDTTVSSGTTYYYVTTAVDVGGAESVYSNQATAAIP
jgi:hypothetical protein